MDQQKKFLTKKGLLRMLRTTRASHPHHMCGAYTPHVRSVRT
ncbi:hypothetical protein [Prevotella histicola]|nr:hypothetical protein [Prevotella histicola]